MTHANRPAEYDEVRVISLPPPITAAVNRLLREEDGWQLLDVHVTDRRDPDGDRSVMVVYVLGHVAQGKPTTSAESDLTV